MIREKWNLRCAKGHNHYSPNPQAFVGQTCGYASATQVAADGSIRRNVPRCTAKQELLKK